MILETCCDQLLRVAASRLFFFSLSTLFDTAKLRKKSETTKFFFNFFRIFFINSPPLRSASRRVTLAKARRQEPRPLRVCALHTATKNTNYWEVSEIVRIFADEIKKGYGNNGIQ